jgi:hypothetical protein
MLGFDSGGIAVDMHSKIPIVILAGSDRRAGAVPSGAEDFHFIVAYKGAELRVGNRLLIQELLDRVRDSDAFGEIYVAGPKRVFESLVDCQIIDTDGTVGDNVRVAMEHVLAVHGDDARIAFLSCDVLPSPAELSDLMACLSIREGDREQDQSAPALAIALVLVPPELGASVWKPKYVIRIDDDEHPVPCLPGHLGVAYPKKLRTGLLFRCIELVYRERNRDYEQRRRDIVLRLMGVLLWRDFLNLLRFRPPTLAYSAVRYGLGAFVAWRKNELTIEMLATGFEKMIVRRQFHRRPASGSVRIAVTPHFSFAQDIDTREELEEIERGLGEAAE